MNVVILGVGNILLSDEGVGVRVVERIGWDYELPPGVRLIDGGTCGMELLADLEGLDALVLVDAVRCGQPPGTVVRLAGDEVPVFFRTKVSPHQVGLSDVLATLALTGQAPARTTIVGVQPVSFETGMELSTVIAARLPDLVAAVVAELAGLGVEAVPRKIPEAVGCA